MYQRISMLLMIVFNCSSFIQMGPVVIRFFINHQSSDQFCQLRGWYECEIFFFSLIFINCIFYIFIILYPFFFFCHLLALQ